MGLQDQNRKSIRLKEYDYSEPGAYFVTICTHNRIVNLGEIQNGKVILSSFGKIAEKWIAETKQHFENIDIPDWVIMPNHVHMILILIDDSSQRRGVVSTPRMATGGEIPPLQAVGVDPSQRKDAVSTLRMATGGETPPLRSQKPFLQNNSKLGWIVAYYKYQTTRQINFVRNNPGATFWQRNYYEHIIRSEDDLHRIQEYIFYNPLRSELDTLLSDNNKKY